MAKRKGIFYKILQTRAGKRAMKKILMAFVTFLFDTLRDKFPGLQDTQVDEKIEDFLKTKINEI